MLADDHLVVFLSYGKYVAHLFCIEILIQSTHVVLLKALSVCFLATG